VSRAPLDTAALLERLSPLLPPNDSGYRAFLEVVMRLDALEQEVGVAPRALEEALARSAMAAREAMALHARDAVPAASVQDAEDAVIELIGRVGGLYRGCRDRRAFSAYFKVSLQRQVKRIYWRRNLADLPPEGDDAAPPPPEEDLELTARALRRFVWYLWGSPDHPESESRSRLSLKKARARVSYLVSVAASFECRPFAGVVYWNQPRAGDWGAGEERAGAVRHKDEGWWRSRATYARGKVKAALQTRDGAAAFERILAGLRGRR